MRGLKPSVSVQDIYPYRVALHVSAWIEADGLSPTPAVLIVALHVSAWIEATCLSMTTRDTAVALHVSAWIEADDTPP